jgi:exodeoxyribonuclease VII small subunit
MTKKDEKMKFEAAIERLEKVVAKLEAGQVPLDESLELFEEGVALSKFCNKKLEEVERKIEQITGDVAPDGTVATKPFPADQ